MEWQFAGLHRYTPTLAVVDPRRLAVRSVAWYRKQVNDVSVVRINRSLFDPAGRSIGSHDPRLWENRAPTNLVNIHSLSAQVLASDSVDAGWRVSLLSESHELLQSWDGRGTARRMEYDVLLRPTGVFENDQCVERLAYGDVNSAPCNQCGQLIRHDDPAGTRLNREFGLTGALLKQTQHVLHDLTRPDWPEAEAERDPLLEPGSGATTHWAYNPLGEVVGQVDAQGNVQTLAHSVAGQLKESRVQLKGLPSQVIVGDIHYDAQGRVESEAAGNGVISAARYQVEDGRLVQLSSRRSNGQVLQDLTYGYDPVGNITRVEDLAQPIRYFANQRIEAVSSYRYDTLYQLTEATGRELASLNHGPVFADFQSPPDPAQCANYTQTYDYDAGGNLQQLSHVGAQSHSRTLVTARYSNRSLAVINNQPPGEEDIAAAFDANGNLLALQAGQTLNWDLRNQLQEVRPVMRESGIDDSERYVYDASGQRLRKVRTTQAKAVSHVAEVRYLPGLEVRTDTATGEILQVITAQAGRNSVRVLHWQAGKPDELANDQYRYGLSDHLGSGTLELDAQAQIISQESYYPFGGTSWWAGRNAIEANYKTVRYSGKERDATGLYYYGLRYYAPWLQRWINPDPAGVIDGLNLFRFVRNSPLHYADGNGAAPDDATLQLEMLHYKQYGFEVITRGLDEFTQPHRQALEEGVAASAWLLNRVVKELKKASPGSGVSSVLKATFGNIDENLQNQMVNRLVASFGKQKEYLESLFGESGSSINIFKDNAGLRGYTYPGSAGQPGKTIAISVRLLEQHHVLDLAKTLIHESSHATDETMDVYYNLYAALLKGSSDEQVTAWSNEARYLLRDVSTHGLDSRFVNLAYVEGSLSTADDQPIDTEALKKSFLEDPHFRAEVLLHNADTYPLFVLGTRLPMKFLARTAEKKALPVGFRKGKEVF
ncbi:RHS repeat-associated core domain-containing protein [Pseudomonas lijiangensis]|uniref:RHS repeat domain-containing protein n=1 Tax=Pseudomonas lijiangensis TaxID=2995658 RepID=UPI0031BA5FA1